MRHSVCAEADTVAVDSSRAAGRPTARLGLRLSCANERARDLAVDLRRDLIDIDARIGEECTCVIDLVDAPGVELDVDESGGPQLRGVLVVAKRASDASDPEFHAATDLCRHVSRG